ncbi:hypothetical protein ACPOLB_21020 [Rubrivivax sp. RP6-9]|uniref:hypothetical protein n=1 Tax=Rubrivivax sp. RP6-9 TaxID=3415750 RepID=UPI003CC5C99B
MKQAAPARAAAVKRARPRLPGIATPPGKTPTMTRSLHHTVASLGLLAALCATSGAHAQANIDQSRAVAGGINSTDTAGFPITLTQSGHYRLTGNLVVPAGLTGIDIQGHNITVDLNGFTISGPVTCSRNASTREVTCANKPAVETFGVSAPSVLQGVTVRNGAVRGFSRGVRLLGQAVVDGVSASHNGHGIDVWGSEGSAGKVMHSRAEMNSGNGITVYSGMVLHSTASRNGWSGFTAGSSAYVQVIDSVATGNARSGFSGMTLRGSLAMDNAANSRTKVQSLGQNVDEQGKY